MPSRILPHREDWRSVAYVLAALALAVLQWTGAARHSALPAAGALLAFLCCIVNHNHQHCPTFGIEALNRAFGVLLTWAIGQPAAAIVPMHLRNHHVHNNHAEDHVRASIVRFRWNLLNLALFPFVAAAGYFRVKSEVMRSWRRDEPELHRRAVFERLALYAVGLAALAVRPWETLAYVIGPWLFGQWAIIAINHVQHDGCDPDSRYSHSRDFTGRWLNGWFLNNGYHTAHHNHPGAHWTLLPAIHERLRPRLDPRLERRSLVGGLVEMYVWPGRISQIRRDCTERVEPQITRISQIDGLPDSDFRRIGAEMR